jgi:hypothetical protein
MRSALPLALFLALAGAAHAGSATGILTGRALISFGCPGPVREGQPGCNPWHAFPGARFAVGGRSLRADAAGRFSLRLAPGRYVVRTLPQAHVRGETTLVARVRAGATTEVVLRFDGFPKMV